MEPKQKMTKPFFAAMAAVALLGTSHAALVAYEGFDTSFGDGTNLPTMQGGDTSFGWGDQGRFNAANSLGITVNSPGLSFGTLDTVGKMATSNFNGSSAGQYRRDMSTSYTIGSGAGERTEMWASWLSTWSGNPSPNNALQWFKLHNDEAEVISAGINNFGGVGGTALEDQWRLSPDGTDSFTGVVANPGDVYQLSMRLSASGPDTLIELFVNSDGDRNLGSALASRTVSGAVTFDQVRLQTQQTSITAQWDEIRIGDSFSDVGLVPEPSAVGLGGLLGLFLLRRRRTA